MVKGIDVGRELLAEGQRSSVLEVGAADFDDVSKSFTFGVEGVAEGGQGWEEGFSKFKDGGNVHDGGEGVVGGGGHIDMVVRVDGVFGAHGAAEDFNGAVRDDFVGIHVRLGAGAGLPDHEREMVDELEGGDFG